MVQAGKAKKIFDGRYEILSIVGRGARSVVYHARHVANPSLEVALKVVVDKEGAPTIRDKLKKEALAMVSCRHPYVVRLDDFHTVENLSYFSMEYAPEGDLRKYVTRLGGKLPADQAGPFFTQCAMAISQIHGCGVIHRDIKPDNILVLHDSEIRIADFGIAVLPGETASIQELESGIGTMDYMAPEVLEGREYTAASDIYALGVVFYEMLSGKHPFENVPLIQQLEARKIENLTPISELVEDLPTHLADAVMRCMSYGTTDRFPSGKELLEFLKSRGKKGAPKTEGAASAPVSETPPPPPASERTNAIGRGYTKKDISFKVGRFKLRQRPNKVHSEDDAPETVKSLPNELTAFPETSESAPQMVANTDAYAEIGLSDPEPSSVESTADISDPPAPADDDYQSEERPSEPLLQSENTDTIAEEPSFSEQEQSPAEEPFTPTDDGSSRFQRQKTVFVDRDQMESVSPRPEVESLAPTRRIPSFKWIVIGLVALFLYSAREDLLGLASNISIPGLGSSVSTHESGSTVIPPVTTTDFVFPELPSGMYVGTIDGLLPLKSVPLTIISLADKGALAIIIGIEGWTPRVIEWPKAPEGDDAQKTPSIRVASNGIVLLMSAQNVDGDLIGYFVNPISGERGDWKASPVTDSEGE